MREVDLGNIAQSVEQRWSKIPTNKERREVAEKIHEMVKDRYSFTALNVADAIGLEEEVVFDDRYAFDEACWLRLAELIDPLHTCRYIKDGNGNYFCAECGAKVVEV